VSGDNIKKQASLMFDFPSNTSMLIYFLR